MSEGVLSFLNGLAGSLGQSINASTEAKIRGKEREKELALQNQARQQQAALEQQAKEQERAQNQAAIQKALNFGTEAPQNPLANSPLANIAQPQAQASQNPLEGTPLAQVPMQGSANPLAGSPLEQAVTPKKGFPTKDEYLKSNLTQMADLFEKPSDVAKARRELEKQYENERKSYGKTNFATQYGQNIIKGQLTPEMMSAAEEYGVDLMPFLNKVSDREYKDMTRKEQMEFRAQDREDRQQAQKELKAMIAASKGGRSGGGRSRSGGRSSGIGLVRDSAGDLVDSKGRIIDEDKYSSDYLASKGLGRPTKAKVTGAPKAGLSQQAALDALRKRFGDI
jgi:hypothetical protein